MTLAAQAEMMREGWKIHAATCGCNHRYCKTSEDTAAVAVAARDDT